MAIHTFYRTASFAVFMLFLKMGRSGIVVAPNNNEAKIGGLTYFNCSTSVTSEEIYWFHYPIGNQDRSFVFGFGQFYTRYIGRFAMENNAVTGEYNLVITSVVAEDAGKYECQDDAGRGKKQSAQLIILDTELVCQSSINVDEVIGPNACGIEPDQLILSCVVQFHGNEAPILQWRLNDSKTPITNDVTLRINGSSAVYSLAIRNYQISNGSVYVCETTRSTTKNSCESGRVKVVGSTTFTEPEKISCGAEITFIVILILIIVAGIVLVVLFIRKPSVFKICNRQDDKKDVENQNAGIDDSVAICLLEKSEVLEIEEPVVMSEMSAKLTQDENEHYEKLRKRLSQSSMIIEQKDKIIYELKKKNEQLRKIIKQLEDEKHELEGRLYPTAITGDYAKTTLVASIEMTDLKQGSKKEKKPIFGMTILHNKLCIITENSSEVAVYDSVTFKSETPWHINRMSNPQDITSCSINDCLYICDGEPKKEKFILRVDSNKTVLNKWTIEQDEGRLSVTREANVVVSLFNGNKIIEYTPNGDLIRTVRLSPADNISHPWHAIKTTSMHFIFSHGTGIDQLHRVCVADVDGKIRKSFGGKKGSEIKEQHMNRPVHLLEDSSRNVLVADMKNKRVFLLSPSLELKKILVSAEKCDLKFPMRLCLDEEKGILFVADNNYKEGVGTYDSGRILIFNCISK